MKSIAILKTTFLLLVADSTTAQTVVMQKTGYLNSTSVLAAMSEVKAIDAQHNIFNRQLSVKDSNMVVAYQTMAQTLK